MLKSILKLDGAQELNKSEQKSINGGGRPGSCCDPELHCCTFGDSPHATGQCCYPSWTGPWGVCFSTGGSTGMECI